MEKITRKFFCDVCKKKAHRCETIMVGIKPRDNLFCASNSGDQLMKEVEICEDCYDKGKAIIELTWKTTFHNDSVGKNIIVNFSIDLKKRNNDV